VQCSAKHYSACTPPHQQLSSVNTSIVWSNSLTVCLWYQHNPTSTTESPVLKAVSRAQHSMCHRFNSDTHTVTAHGKCCIHYFTTHFCAYHVCTWVIFVHQVLYTDACKQKLQCCTDTTVPFCSIDYTGGFYNLGRLFSTHCSSYE